MTEQSISKQLDEVLLSLTPDQLRFVVEMPNHKTKKSCAIALGLSVNSAYNFPDSVDKAIELMARNVIEGALAIRKRNLAKAMMVKMAGLDLDDNALRQRVATEIIEWETGKAMQKTDITSGGDKIQVMVTYADDND